MAELSWQIALANLSVSWGLVLLIWLVQIIIYPTFARIPADRFRQYHRLNSVKNEDLVPF